MGLWFLEGYLPGFLSVYCCDGSIIEAVIEFSGPGLKPTSRKFTLALGTI